MTMPPRILVLEDEPDLLRALSIRLRAAGFACETSSNGKDALEKIQRNPPMLLLTDLVMPDVDGYEVLRQLKANPRTASIPTIVLTAVPRHAIARRMHELEGTVVIHKPFEFGELLAKVQELIATSTPEGGTPHG